MSDEVSERRSEGVGPEKVCSKCKKSNVQFTNQNKQCNSCLEKKRAYDKTNKDAITRHRVDNGIEVKMGRPKVKKDVVPPKPRGRPAREIQTKPENPPKSRGRPRKPDADLKYPRRIKHQIEDVNNTDI